MKSRVLTRKWRVFIFVPVLFIFLVQDTSYGQGRAKIYWTESDKIRRANLDGSNVEDILTELEWPQDIALDLHNRKIYWIDAKEIKILRANLDGSNIETLITGLKRPPGGTKMHIDVTIGNVMQQCHLMMMLRLKCQMTT